MIFFVTFIQKPPLHITNYFERYPDNVYLQDTTLSRIIKCLTQLDKPNLALLYEQFLTNTPNRPNYNYLIKDSNLDTSKYLTEYWKYLFDINLIESLGANAVISGDLNTFEYLKNLVKSDLGVSGLKKGVREDDVAESDLMERMVVDERKFLDLSRVMFYRFV